MRKLVIFIGLLIIVFSFSGCTFGRLNEFPPRAFDEEYIKESTEKGEKLGELTAQYFWDVLEVLEIEIPTASDLGESINEQLPTEEEIITEIEKILPTEQEIIEGSEKISEELKDAFEENAETLKNNR